MLILKLIEIAAHAVYLRLDRGVSRGNRLPHASVQILKISVEVGAALALSCLSLEYHSLSELSSYLNDRINAGHRVLEDHRYLVAADLMEILLRYLKEIL